MLNKCWGETGEEERPVGGGRDGECARLSRGQQERSL